MVAMVASASGYGTLRRFLSAPEGQHDVEEVGAVPSTSVAVSVSFASCCSGPNSTSNVNMYYVSLIKVYN